METASHTGIPDLTPEKLAIMKLNTSEFDGDLFSEPTTPTAVHRTFDYGGHGKSSSRSVARSTRSVTRSSRRSSSFMTTHRSKMSMELTAQAESKFFALVELMASASREASSLKEVWAKIISERESFTREREELLEQITEVTEELERQEGERGKHGHEVIERRKQVEKLLIELSAALTTIATEKKKVAERDLELEQTRDELREVKDSILRTHADYERVRTELETLTVTLKTVEDDRDCARDEAAKHERELHKVTRERTDLSNKLIDVVSKHEQSRKEVLSLTDRLKMYDLEREEHILEVERLKEDARRSRARAEESSKELFEKTEHYDRVQRDFHKVKETIRVVESERDEHVHTIEHLRRDLKTTGTLRDEAEERCSGITVKYEQIKRELLLIKDKIRDVELERSEHLEIIERTREQHRVVVVERDELKEEVTSTHAAAEESRRRVIILTESLRKTEQTLSEVRSEVTSLTERVRHLDHERSEARSKNNILIAEIAELKETLIVVQTEVRTLTETRDRLRGELERSRRECEEITTTYTSYKDDSTELEFEIESLRTMYNEAREQKERAISARAAADRERDEYIAKFEEKCREMERFEESAAAHYHSHNSRSGGRITSTSHTVSHSSSAVNNGTC